MVLITTSIRNGSTNVMNKMNNPNKVLKGEPNQEEFYTAWYLVWFFFCLMQKEIMCFKTPVQMDPSFRNRGSG